MFSEDTKDPSPVSSAYFRGGKWEVGGQWLASPRDEGPLPAPNPVGSTMDLGDPTYTGDTKGLSTCTWGVGCAGSTEGWRTAGWEGPGSCVTGTVVAAFVCVGQRREMRGLFYYGRPQ